MRYKITLTYDGADFCGWQSQPSGKSIQDAIERAITALTGERAKVVGSGRTDAGVHALAQVAHFDLARDIPDKTVVGGLNAHLPRTVRVLSAEHADDSFDARRSTKAKTYMYLMYRGESTPLLDGRALYLGAKPDVEAMRAAAACYKGTHDFTTFAAAGGGAKTFTRTVYSSEVKDDGRFIKFFVTADGFLYNMVRIMTGQLVLAANGTPPDIPALIDKRDRTAAKQTAPAYGLYLYKVEY